MGKVLKKGFTLVEILIVLVVIGIILAVVLPNTLRAIETANVRDSAATLRSIDTAINVCYAQTRVWGSCDSIAELTGAVPPYLDALQSPNDPFGVPYALQATVSGGWESIKITHFPLWPALDPHL